MDPASFECAICLGRKHHICSLYLSENPFFHNDDQSAKFRLELKMCEKIILDIKIIYRNMNMHILYCIKDLTSYFRNIPARDPVNVSKHFFARILAPCRALLH